MQIRDYLRAFRRRAWIPAVLALVAMLTAGGVSLFSPPTYTATAAVFAAVPGTGGVRTVSFTQTATSTTLAGKVIKALKLNDSLDGVLQRVRVTALGSDLYDISVTGPNPGGTITLANTVAGQSATLYQQIAAQASTSQTVKELDTLRATLRDQYTAALIARLSFEAKNPKALPTATAPPKDVSAAAQLLQLQLEEDAAGAAYRNALAQASQQQLDQLATAANYNSFVLDQAVARPNTGARIPQTLLAAALALVIGAGLVFLLEYLDTKSVRNPETVEDVVNAPVIGTIPRATPQNLRSARGANR
jgi:capsular polysaccharide biosynthesis protein